MASSPKSLVPSPDQDVRRYDEDRWLASRFAPASVRERLIAIYALNHEIARTADVVSQPALGDIRLAWWREALGELAAGKPPRAHPILQTYAEAQRDAPLPLAAWERLIERRSEDLDAAPFAAWAELEDYVDATAGGVMRIAIAACRADPAAHADFVRAAAQAWGCVGLLRAEPHWRARGRALVPAAGSLEELSARAHRAIAEAQGLSRQRPADIFPAIGYVALAPGYLRALRHGRGETALLLRQLTLIAAAAKGRL